MDSKADIRDQLAMAVLPALIQRDGYDCERIMAEAYRFADAGMVARAPKAKQVSVGDLDLSVRAMNGLHSIGMRPEHPAATILEMNCRRMHRFGHRSFWDVNRKLILFGFDIADSVWMKQSGEWGSEWRSRVSEGLEPYYA